MNAVLRPLDDDDRDLMAVLTDKQREFVRQVTLTGGNQTKAAELAGYASPGSAGYALMQLPHIQAAVRAETERMLTGAGAKAVGWMVKALDDPKLPGAVRFQSAKWLAEAAGHGLAAHRAALGMPPQDKPLSEMTLDELDAFISAGKAATERLRQDRERTIDGSAQVVRDDARNGGGDPA